MKPFFSIIMPCYNSSKYLTMAVQSVINQTFRNWELLVIDDGSTDNTLEMLRAFSIEDSRIRVFAKKWGGVLR